jgi:hypothetical protein
MIGERIQFIDIGLIFVTFAGVTLLSFGNKVDPNSSGIIATPMLVYVGAVAVPILMSVNSIMMRKM